MTESLKRSLGTRWGDEAFLHTADLNQDGIINVLDLATLRVKGPNTTARRTTVVERDALISEPIPIEALPGNIQPGGTACAFFRIRGNATPVLGYSLDVRIVPSSNATGTVIADSAATNFFDSRNLIAAGGAARDSFFSVIQDNGSGGVFINTITDDNSTVFATPGVNDILAQVVVHASPDASGSFRVELGVATALSDANASPIPYTFTPATFLVGDESTCDLLANNPPLCAAAIPEAAECAGPRTSVLLDGSASSDPDHDAPAGTIISQLTDPPNQDLDVFTDIVTARIEQSGEFLTFVIETRGPIPTTLPLPTDVITFLWLVDADNNPATGQPHGGVGSEFNVRVVIGELFGGGFVDVTGDIPGGGDGTIDVVNNRVAFTIPLAAIASPAQFHWRSDAFQVLNDTPGTGNGGETGIASAAPFALDGGLGFSWTTDCPVGVFNDATLATPVLTMNTPATCNLDCTATLTVSDGIEDATCSVPVAIRDTTTPTVSCPPDQTLPCGASIDPNATGVATSIDTCDPTPAVTFSDATTPTACRGNPTLDTITRTWTATDACTHSHSCTQSLFILKEPLYVDIKPGTCPNTFGTRDGGLLPVAIVKTPAVDLTTIDRSTLTISRTDCVGGSVAPKSTKLADVATPFTGEPCACHGLKGDRLTDLLLHFDMSTVLSTLELTNLPPGTAVELAVTGNLRNGCSFIATDCLLRNSSPPQSSSDATESPPADEQVERTPSAISAGPQFCGALGSATLFLTFLSLAGLHVVSRRKSLGRTAVDSRPVLKQEYQTTGIR